MKHAAPFLPVAAAMGYDAEADGRSAALLRDLLPPGSDAAWRDLAALVRGRTVRCFGAGPALARVDPVAVRRGCDVVVAADGATLHLLRGGVVPHAIVSDLDGDVPSQVAANRRGAVAVVHAHGDNAAALRRWVPALGGRVVGTSQVDGVPGVPYVGGFTDGDRCAFLAARLGAARLELVGYDFSAAPSPFSKPPSETKRRKFALAERLLVDLGRRVPLAFREPASL